MMMTTFAVRLDLDVASDDVAACPLRFHLALAFPLHFLLALIAAV